MFEIDTYFSFEDFEKNYQDDLKDWLNYYSNGTEFLYLEELKNKYSFFIENNSINLTDIKAFPIYPIMNDSSNKYSRISLNKLAVILEERINYILSNNIQIFNDMVEEKTPYENQNPFKNPVLFIYNCDFDINEFDTDDYFDINLLEGILPFFNFRDRDEYGYKKKICVVSINEQKVKDFELAIRQILNFIIDRENELNNPNLISIPNLPESSIVEKVIYLHELGVIDFLIRKQPFDTSANKLATVLSTILKEDSGTLQPYLNALINGKKGTKNHPYNSDNTVKKIKSLLINEGFKYN